MPRATLDLVYCATDTQVPAAKTAELLKRMRAVWCPPPRLRPWHVPVPPVGGERIWLLWFSQGRVPILLGGGRLEVAPRQLFGTQVLWTNADLKGLKNAAIGLGYAGPTNMSFLLVADPMSPNNGARPPVAPAAGLPSGLNDSNSALSNYLAGFLPIR